MKKLLLPLLCALLIFLAGCDEDLPFIYMSSKPITQEEFTPEQFFKVGSRINFVLVSQDAFTNSAIRIQVLHQNPKVTYGGFDIAHARDIEIDPTKKYFISDFYLYAPGYYVLRVFGKDDLRRPIAQQEFRVY